MARIDQLIQIDLLMAEAVRRGGAWIVCRPGCHECCLGPFPITTADAQRLHDGLSRLDLSARRLIRERAASYLALIHSYDTDGLPEGVDDVPCPALDPVTGCCDLYDVRPITCRTFGPAVRAADGSIATCELCFQSASPDEIAACAVDLPPDVDGEEATFVAATLAGLC